MKILSLTVRSTLYIAALSFCLECAKAAMKPTAFVPPMLEVSTTSASPLDSIQNFFKNTFSAPSKKGEKNNADDDLRLKLKMELLTECKATNSKNMSEQRTKIESIMKELSSLSPVAETAASPLLQKPWLMFWTTEKEINFFNDWKISDGNITQIISDGSVLQNNIPFTRGGSLSVEGTLSLSSDEQGQQSLRTYFKFTNAVLDVGKWGRFELPPVGEGWFDTVYLDDDLRVDINSRNDILICSPL